MADEWSGNEALQRRHFTRAGWATLVKNMRNNGNLRTRAEELIGNRLESKSADVRQEARRWDKNIVPHLEDKPIIFNQAVQRREDLFYAGLERGEAEDIDHLGGDGMAWYFNHHRKIRDAMVGTDFEGYDGERNVNRAIEASGMMSPQNDPKNELRAVTALAGQVTRGQRHLTKDVKAGGTNENINRARRHLKNGTEQTDYTGEPKVGPYTDAIKNAVPTVRQFQDPETGETKEDFYAMDPNAPEGVGMVEQEYRERARLVRGMASGAISPGQMSLDFTGLRDSREGILNPEGATAEDTWMNAVTYGQDRSKKSGRSVIAKTGASEQGLSLGVGNEPHDGKGPNAYVNSGDRQRQAAYNNAATMDAAQNIGEHLGVVGSDGQSIVPSVMAQEVPWTEVRREVGKDPEYNKDSRQQGKDDRAAVKAEKARLKVSDEADKQAKRRYGGTDSATGWQGEQLTLPGFE